MTNIAVDPAYQHMGLGRFLMQFMIGRAIDYGSQKITLEVRTNNDIAKRSVPLARFSGREELKKAIMSATTMMRWICIGHCRNFGRSSSIVEENNVAARELILAFESSCDETSVAVVENGDHNPIEHHRHANQESSAVWRRCTGGSQSSPCGTDYVGYRCSVERSGRHL